jgi:uncharacterized protein YndB with AHSA1/START domain
VNTPDVPHRFELELVVPGSPEQVWHAIASGEGTSAWMTPADVEPRPGGHVEFHMGPGATSRGRVTAFEPQRRFEYEEDWAALVGREGADVTPLVTEFLVDARTGGTCVVRVVTSAFGTGADWENEFWEEMNTGWAPILDNLRLYLTHFPGQRATSVWAGTTVTASPEASIAAVRDALSVEVTGDAVTTQGIQGHLERSIARHLLVRVDEPVPGYLSFYAFADDDRSGVHLQCFLFSDRAPAYVEREQPRWQTWLDGVTADVATSKNFSR